MFEHVQFVFYDSVVKVSAQNGYCHYQNQYLLAVVQQCTHSRSLMETKHKVNASGFTLCFFTLKVLKVVLLKATFTQHFIQCIKHFLTIMRCRGWVRGGSVCWPSTMRTTGTSELLFGTRHREEHTGFTACVLYLGCYVGQHLI